MKIVIEVGGWEHQCCGRAIERGDVVTFDCIRHTEADGQVRLIESHHDLGSSKRVRGRVLNIHAIEETGVSRPALRLPSGCALRESDPTDDGHLQDPGTGKVVPSDGINSLVTVLTSP